MPCGIANHINTSRHIELHDCCELKMFKNRSINNMKYEKTKLDYIHIRNQIEQKICVLLLVAECLVKGNRIFVQFGFRRKDEKRGATIFSKDIKLWIAGLASKFYKRQLQKMEAVVYVFYSLFKSAKTPAHNTEGVLTGGSIEDIAFSTNSCKPLMR